MTWFRRDVHDSRSVDRDPMVAEALESLDPSSHDPNYWFRFHGRVMAGAASELARRRMMANLTVVDVMASWSKTLVPTAMLAAAVAALLLVRAESANLESGPVANDMVAELPGEPVPAIRDVGVLVAFASFAPDNF